MWPHPISDSNGHSYSHRTDVIHLPERTAWQSCEEYLFGIDLFNHGYYWESHETWESLWHAAGRKNVDTDFFKGLIKLAAAGVKAREGRQDGVTRHLARGSEILNSVRNELSDEETVWGFAFTPLLAMIDQWKALPFDKRWTTSAPVLKVWTENLVLGP
jgi:hypothetical protein